MTAHTAVFAPPAPTLISAYTPPPLSISTPTSATNLNLVYGGPGIVRGTVKKVPGEPLRRRVRLHDEVGMGLVRETWSDATTGAFEFTGLSPARSYTVIAYDHLHDYRAQIIDRVEAQV